jgi:hypothetical protein
MYPELYQKWFKLTLNPAELVLMEIVGLLSKVTLGHLANNLPLPILAASRLKTLQRFLNSPRFCKEKIWWGIWIELMTGYWKKKEQIPLVCHSGRGKIEIKSGKGDRAYDTAKNFTTDNQLYRPILPAVSKYISRSQKL